MFLSKRNEELASKFVSPTDDSSKDTQMGIFFVGEIAFADCHTFDTHTDAISLINIPSHLNYWLHPNGIHPSAIHSYINRMQIVYDDDDLYFCDQFSFVKSNMYRTKRHEHKRKVYHLKLSKIVKWKIKF